MGFEFDPRKSDENLKRHGIDFSEAQQLWEGSHVIIPAKNVSRESRSAILGLIRGRVYMAVFTGRENVTRIISCHRADKKWEKMYYEYLKKKSDKENNIS